VSPRDGLEGGSRGISRKSLNRLYLDLNFSSGLPEDRRGQQSEVIMYILTVFISAV